MTPERLSPQPGGNRYRNVPVIAIGATSALRWSMARHGPAFNTLAPSTKGGAVLEPKGRGRAGTVGTLGQIAPVSQSNSQSSECVGPDFGTAGTGTPAVGTRITASGVIIVTMLALAALALIAKLGGGFR